MSRKLAVLAFATLLAAAAPAFAQQAGPRADGLTVVSLSESAQREIRRDRLRIQLRAEQAGTDATRVQNEINRRMAAALEKAKPLAGDGLRVETGGYYVHQERSQDQSMRWRGAQMLVLSGSDAAALLQLAGRLQQDGFLVGGMDWELSGEARRKAEDALTGEALERLRARSRFVADAMGGEFLRFDKVSVGTSSERPPIAMRGPAPMAAAAGVPAAVPIASEPGLEFVQVGVQAEILVKPRP
jgi:predicted secreted protein